MKRFIIGAAFALLACFALVSCEINGATVRTYEYTVSPSDWRPDDNGTTIYAVFPNSHITPGAIENGLLTGYIFLGDVNTWTPLPYVYTYTATGAAKKVGETIRCEFEPEKVYFVIEDLDGFAPERVGGDMVFKVVRIY